MPFYQDAPELLNTYDGDGFLQRWLKIKIPPQYLAEINLDLHRFGQRCATDLMDLANAAELSPPRHVPYNAWGRRVDHIECASAWNEFHTVAAQEGLVAIGYERKQQEFSRVFQFAKLYLFHPSSAIYTCPLAMTDGAARVIELSGSPELKSRTFPRLISRDPKIFWTSGQWMTERTGGSDVSGTSTCARFASDGYALYGDKWFTSATTSQMAMALAKVEGANDTRGGLSLFYVELRDAKGELRNIKINRLKDKLGTKSLPTAELTLEGTPGVLIGEVGEGVKRVSSLLNITRLYNSVTAAGAMARGLQLAKDYAQKRTAFGRRLEQHPLHLQTLADLRCDSEAVNHLVFHLIHLLGKEETARSSPQENVLLRLLTPVVKLWSAKQCMKVMSEVLESFGGAGYIEDTGLPRMLREAQVFSIWEGTTNVLSLDTLRAIEKDDSLSIYLDDVRTRLNKVSATGLKDAAENCRLHADRIDRYFKMAGDHGQDFRQAGARAFAFGLARVFAASLMLEFAELEQTQIAKELALRFCKMELFTEVPTEQHNPDSLHRLVFGS